MGEAAIYLGSRVPGTQWEGKGRKIQNDYQGFCFGSWITIHDTENNRKGGNSRRRRWIQYDMVSWSNASQLGANLQQSLRDLSVQFKEELEIWVRARNIGMKILSMQMLKPPGLVRFPDCGEGRSRRLGHHPEWHPCLVHLDRESPPAALGWHFHLQHGDLPSCLPEALP